ncbi:hypothetical protein NO2_0001, partial [Candidatus Termititenax persephonae]
QLDLVNTLKDLFSINAYMPAQDLAGLVKYGREYGLGDDLYGRRVERFNPAAGYVADNTVSTYTPLDADNQKKITEFYKSKFGENGWSEGSYEDAYDAVQSMKPRSVTGGNSAPQSSFSAAFYKDNQFNTQKAIADMANIGTYIKGGDFWSFDDVAFEQARARLIFQRNLLSIMAMLVEAEMESHNIVASELEMPGSEEGYKSMKASQIIQTETDYLIKGVNELKKEATGVVTQHNQLMESIQTKKLDEEQKFIDDKLLYKGTTLSITAITLYLAAQTATMIAENVARGLIGGFFTTPFGLILLGLMVALSGVLKKIPSVASTAMTLARDASNVLFAKEKLKLSEEKTDSTKDTLKSSLKSARDEIALAGQIRMISMVTSSHQETAAVSKNLFQQYGLLNSASNVKFLSGEDGLYYEDEEQMLLIERDLSRQQIVNRSLLSLHGAKAQSHASVHQEMTGKSSYNSSNVAQTMIEQEQSIITEKFNELRQLRQEYAAAMNSKIQADINKTKLVAKAETNKAAFVLGCGTQLIPVVGIGPSTLMGIASTIFSFAESRGKFDKDDQRPLLQTDSLLGSRVISNMELAKVGGNILTEMNKGSAIKLTSGSVGKSGNPISGYSRSVGAVRLEFEAVDTSSGQSEQESRDNPNLIFTTDNSFGLNSGLLAEFIRDYSGFSLNNGRLAIGRTMTQSEYEALISKINKQYKDNNTVVDGLNASITQQAGDPSQVANGTIHEDWVALNIPYLTPGLEEYFRQNSAKYKLGSDGKWYMKVTYVATHTTVTEGTSTTTVYTWERAASFNADKNNLKSFLFEEQNSLTEAAQDIYQASNFRFVVTLDYKLSDKFKKEFKNRDQFTWEEVDIISPITGLVIRTTTYLYMVGILDENSVNSFIGGKDLEMDEPEDIPDDVEVKMPEKQSAPGLEEGDRKAIAALQKKAEKYFTTDEDDTSKYYWDAPSVKMNSCPFSEARLAELGLMYDPVFKRIFALDKDNFKKNYKTWLSAGERQVLKELIEAVDPASKEGNAPSDKEMQGDAATTVETPDYIATDSIPGVQSDGYSNEITGGFDGNWKSQDYQMMYRARIAKMRYDLTCQVNIRRCEYMLKRYELESRNIVHQEMTNTTTYQLSTVPEQALTAEYSYINSVIAAYASREEQRINTHNTILEREESRVRNLTIGIAGPFGFLVSAAWRPKVLGIEVGEVETKNKNIGITGISNGVSDDDLKNLNNYRNVNGTSTAIIDSSHNNVNAYDLASLDRFIDDKTVTTNFFGIKAIQIVPNVDELQKATAAIYSLIYINACLQSLYSAKSASRSMVHSILTNVSNLTLSSYSGAAIQSENALITAKAQDLSKNVSDLAAMAQKKAEAVQEQEAAEWKARISFLAEVVTGVLAAGPLLFARPVPEVGGYVELIQTVGSILNTLFDLFYSIGKSMALDELVRQNAEENKDMVKKAKENEQKARKNSIGTEEGQAEANVQEIGDETISPSGNSSAAKFQMSMIQAQMKKTERVKAAMRKIKKAANDSRGKITAKLSGTPGAQITGAAEMVAGAESGAAEAMLSEMMNIASSNETVEKKKAAIGSEIAGNASAFANSVKSMAEMGMKLNALSKDKNATLGGTLTELGKLAKNSGNAGEFFKGMGKALLGAMGIGSKGDSGGGGDATGGQPEGGTLTELGKLAKSGNAKEFFKGLGKTLLGAMGIGSYKKTMTEMKAGVAKRNGGGAATGGQSDAPAPASDGGAGGGDAGGAPSESPSSGDTSGSSPAPAPAAPAAPAPSPAPAAPAPSPAPAAAATPASTSGGGNAGGGAPPESSSSDTSAPSAPAPAPAAPADGGGTSQPAAAPAPAPVSDGGSTPEPSIASEPAPPSDGNEEEDPNKPATATNTKDPGGDAGAWRAFGASGILQDTVGGIAGPAARLLGLGGAGYDGMSEEEAAMSVIFDVFGLTTILKLAQAFANILNGGLFTVNSGQVVKPGSVPDTASTASTPAPTPDTPPPPIPGEGGGQQEPLQTTGTGVAGHLGTETTADTIEEIPGQETRGVAIYGMKLRDGKEGGSTDVQGNKHLGRTDTDVEQDRDQDSYTVWANIMDIEARNDKGTILFSKIQEGVQANKDRLTEAKVTGESVLVGDEALLKELGDGERRDNAGNTYTPIKDSNGNVTGVQIRDKDGKPTAIITTPEGAAKMAEEKYGFTREQQDAGGFGVATSQETEKRYFFTGITAAKTTKTPGTTRVIPGTTTQRTSGSLDFETSGDIQLSGTLNIVNSDNIEGSTVKIGSETVTLDKNGKATMADGTVIDVSKDPEKGFIIGVAKEEAKQQVEVNMSFGDAGTFGGTVDLEKMELVIDGLPPAKLAVKVDDQGNPVLDPEGNPVYTAEVKDANGKVLATLEGSMNKEGKISMTGAMSASAFAVPAASEGTFGAAGAGASAATNSGETSISAVPAAETATPENSPTMPKHDNPIAVKTKAGATLTDYGDYMTYEVEGELFYALPETKTETKTDENGETKTTTSTLEGQFSLYQASDVQMGGDGTPQAKDGAESVGDASREGNKRGGNDYNMNMPEEYKPYNDSWWTSIDYAMKAITAFLKKHAEEKRIEAEMDALSEVIGGMATLLAGLDPRDAQEVMSTLSGSYMDESEINVSSHSAFIESLQKMSLGEGVQDKFNTDPAGSAAGWLFLGAQKAGGAIRDSRLKNIVLKKAVVDGMIETLLKERGLEPNTPAYIEEASKLSNSTTIDINKVRDMVRSLKLAGISDPKQASDISAALFTKFTENGNKISNAEIATILSENGRQNIERQTLDWIRRRTQAICTDTRERVAHPEKYITAYDEQLSSDPNVQKAAQALRGVEAKFQAKLDAAGIQKKTITDSRPPIHYYVKTDEDGGVRIWMPKGADAQRIVADFVQKADPPLPENTSISVTDGTQTAGEIVSTGYVVGADGVVKQAETPAVDGAVALPQDDTAPAQPRTRTAEFKDFEDVMAGQEEYQQAVDNYYKALLPYETSPYLSGNRIDLLGLLKGTVAMPGVSFLVNGERILPDEARGLPELIGGENKIEIVVDTEHFQATNLDELNDILCTDSGNFSVTLCRNGKPLLGCKDLAPTDYRVGVILAARPKGQSITMADIINNGRQAKVMLDFSQTSRNKLAQAGAKRICNSLDGLDRQKDFLQRKHEALTGSSWIPLHLSDVSYNNILQDTQITNPSTDPAQLETQRHQAVQDVLGANILALYTLDEADEITTEQKGILAAMEREYLEVSQKKLGLEPSVAQAQLTELRNTVDGMAKDHTGDFGKQLAQARQIVGSSAKLGDLNTARNNACTGGLGNNEIMEYAKLFRDNPAMLRRLMQQIVDRHQFSGAPIGYDPEYQKIVAAHEVAISKLNVEIDGLQDQMDEILVVPEEQRTEEQKQKLNELQRQVSQAQAVRQELKTALEDFNKGIHLLLSTSVTRFLESGQNNPGLSYAEIKKKGNGTDIEATLRRSANQMCAARALYENRKDAQNLDKVLSELPTLDYKEATESFAKTVVLLGGDKSEETLLSVRNAVTGFTDFYANNLDASAEAMRAKAEKLKELLIATGTLRRDDEEGIRAFSERIEQLIGYKYSDSVSLAPEQITERRQAQAAIALVEITKILSSQTQVILFHESDLTTSTTSGGAGPLLTDAACRQVARYFSLPGSAASGSSPDIQATDGSSQTARPPATPEQVYNIAKNLETFSAIVKNDAWTHPSPPPPPNPKDYGGEESSGYKMAFAKYQNIQESSSWAKLSYFDDLVGTNFATQADVDMLAWDREHSRPELQEGADEEEYNKLLAQYDQDRTTERESMATAILEKVWGGLINDETTELINQTGRDIAAARADTSVHDSGRPYNLTALRDLRDTLPKLPPIMENIANQMRQEEVGRLFSTSVTPYLSQLESAADSMRKNYFVQYEADTFVVDNQGASSASTGLWRGGLTQDEESDATDVRGADNRAGLVFYKPGTRNTNTLEIVAGYMDRLDDGFQQNPPRPPINIPPPGTDFVLAADEGTSQIANMRTSIIQLAAQEGYNVVEKDGGIAIDNPEIMAVLEQLDRLQTARYDAILNRYETQVYDEQTPPPLDANGQPTLTPEIKAEAVRRAQAYVVHNIKVKQPTNSLGGGTVQESHGSTYRNKDGVNTEVKLSADGLLKSVTLDGLQPPYKADDLRRLGYEEEPPGSGKWSNARFVRSVLNTDGAPHLNSADILLLTNNIDINNVDLSKIVFEPGSTEINYKASAEALGFTAVPGEPMKEEEIEEQVNEYIRERLDQIADMDNGKIRVGINIMGDGAILADDAGAGASGGSRMLGQGRIAALHAAAGRIDNSDNPIGGEVVACVTNLEAFEKAAGIDVDKLAAAANMSVAEYRQTDEYKKAIAPALEKAGFVAGAVVEATGDDGRGLGTARRIAAGQGSRQTVEYGQVSGEPGSDWRSLNKGYAAVQFPQGSAAAPVPPAPGSVDTEEALAAAEETAAPALAEPQRIVSTEPEPALAT